MTAQHPPAPRRRTARLLLAVGLPLALIAALAVVWTLRAADHSDRPAPPAPQTLPTQPATRGDLTATTQVTGNLGYAGTRTLVGLQPGILTRLPAVGAVIARGAVAYSVNGRPIPLLYGTVPLYRDLGIGDDGGDVRVLDSNLVALGFAGGTTLADGHYSATTAAAVDLWQSSLGLPETGTVQAGAAVVVPGAVRITSVTPQIGQPAARGQVLAAGTGTSRQIHLDLDVADQQYAHTGEKVTVVLPSGATTGGRITSVGTVATPAGSGDSGGQAGPAAQDSDSNSGSGDDSGSGQETIPVDISLTGTPHGLAGLDQALVNVNLVQATRHNVLSVPVQALLARPNGYAVTVVNDTGRHTVPVSTGLFTDGRVEITGSGISAGTQVEVPTL